MITIDGVIHTIVASGEGESRIRGGAFAREESVHANAVAVDRQGIVYVTEGDRARRLKPIVR